MKLPYIYFLLFLFSINLNAQSFTEIGTPFIGVVNSTIACSDIDGDNDLDVLISGLTSSQVRTTNLYANDGMGNFTEIQDIPFDGARYGSIAFSDVDGDGDQDVLITGQNNSFINVTKLYMNDGMGDFTEMQDTPFEGVWFSSIAFSDVDGDDDQDVFIAGEISLGNRISKLYMNDGMGNFTEMQDAPFVAISEGSIAFADVDSDNDQDLLITGIEGPDLVTKLYINDGMGNFTELSGTSFDAVEGGSIAFSDIDEDGDQDVLFTGFNGSARIAKLYTNDGTGNFTEIQGTPFQGVWFSSIAFSDVDNDGDEDLLIMGSFLGPMAITKLYANDGAGNFMEVPGTPFPEASSGSVIFSDVDNDSDQDIFIVGSNTPLGIFSKLFINNLIPLPGEQCSNAESVQNLFGGPENEPQTSGLFDNSGYAAEDGTANCFELDDLDATRWFSFTGDGNTYRITVPTCNSNDPIQDDDTQIIIYEGSCDGLTQVGCNDDENDASLVAGLTINTTDNQVYSFLVDGFSGDGNSPEGEFCLEVTNLGPSSTTDIQQTSLRLFPNPTSGLLRLDDVKVEEVAIFDLTGRQLAAYSRPGNQIDISALTTGVYVLRIQAEDGQSYAARVMKE